VQVPRLAGSRPKGETTIRSAAPESSERAQFGDEAEADGLWSAPYARTRWYQFRLRYPVFHREGWVRAWHAEWSRGIGFLALPPLIAAGAVLYFLLPAEPSTIALAAAFFAWGVLAWFMRARFAWHLVCLALLALILGAAAAKFETARKNTPILGSPIATELTGRVVLVELQASGRTRLTLDVLSTARPQLRYAPKRVRVTARQAPADLLPGETVRGLVRLMPPSGPVRPGSYDFAFQSYFDGLGAIGFFLRDPVRADDIGTPPSLSELMAQRIQQLRMAIAARIRAVIAGPAGEIAAALIAGVRAGIPEEVNEDLRITGLAHVLSISGLHMALAAATIMGAVRGLFALFPAFAARHAIKKYAALAALAGTGFYLLLAGDQVAASRSFLMIAIMLTAIMFDRAALSMRNLAIAGLIILLITPHEVMGPSFQMSFAATAALIAGYTGWTQWRSSREAHAPPSRRSTGSRLWRYVLILLAGSVATSVLAGGATAIFGAYHFGRVSPLTLLANLATMPIISLLIMPPAVAAVALMPIGLEAWPLQVMGFGLDLMLAVAHWLAQRSPADGVGIVPASAVILLSIALVAGCLTTTRLRLIALPFALAGMLALANRQAPDLYVSEDGRLLGLAVAGEKLAVNRDRPNSFTVEDWQRAASATALVKPTNSEDAADVFRCTEGKCQIDTPAGWRIVSLPEGADLQPFCGLAAVIVIDDATVRSNACRRSRTILLTKRDLAQEGSATIHFSPDDGKPVLRQAIAKPYRPWHEHRRFSREARGMPAYRPKKDDTPPAPPVPRAGASDPISTFGSDQPADPAP
jgi:ComEC/Rec2-related protein